MPEMIENRTVVDSEWYWLENHRKTRQQRQREAYEEEERKGKKEWKTTK